jgi:hypothetical protein
MAGENAKRDDNRIPVMLFLGSDGNSYQVKGDEVTGRIYVDIPASLSNPMTDSGDIIYGGVLGTPTRLTKGLDGNVLTLESGIPKWDTVGSGDVSGPATNTDNYIPQWNGANSKTLKDGIPTSTFQTALGFTAENVANKKTDLTDNSDTFYPSQKAVKTAVDAKADKESPIFTTKIETPTIELGHASDTTLSRPGAGRIQIEGKEVATLDNTMTFTNKRITPRVTSEASSATPTINTDNSDAHSITALAADITSFTTNLSGTPTNFQKLIIRIKDNGTARTIAWGASFESKGVVLPTTTVISKVLTVGFIYDTVTSKWGCVASSQEA